MCVILCLLFPVAAPLFFSLFIGVVIKESGLKNVNDFISGPMLYGSTFFLGILLGVLCDAHTLLDPTVAQTARPGDSRPVSGIGGILGGYLMYFFKRGNFNPVIGIAAVSCVPTTAKVAQKIVAHDNPSSMILPDALGANIMGVITSAIIAAIYVTVVPML
ncbi:MAG: sodium ion-translocating decarboxylase subunit beta [Alistipes shahii]